MRIIFPVPEKKDLKLLSLIFILFLVFGVMAYSNYINGVPSSMGHTSDETDVKKLDGGIVTLQAFVNNPDLGGKSFNVIKQYSSSASCNPTGSCPSEALCGAGERAVGGGCSFTSTGTQFRIGRPEDGNGDGIWDKWACLQYAGAFSQTRAYVICVS